MTSTTIVAGFLFGTIGLGFFLYGKKQQRIPPLVYGIVLMVLPYVVRELLPMVLTTFAVTGVFVIVMKRGG